MNDGQGRGHSSQAVAYRGTSTTRVRRLGSHVLCVQAALQQRPLNVAARIPANAWQQNCAEINLGDPCCPTLNKHQDIGFVSRLVKP